MKKCIIAITTPIFVACVAITIMLLLKVPGRSVCRLDFVLNAIITCAATFSGFILTSVSILIGLSASEIMKDIRGSGGLTELRCRYTENLIIGFAVIIYSIVLGAIADETNYIYANWFIGGIGLLICYLFSIITSGYYLLSIIAKIPMEKTITTDNKPSVPPGNFQ